MKLKISNQQVTITEALPLVSDTENVYEAEYEFDEEWEGYQRTAVYEGCGASYQVVLTNTNKCKIPNEIIADSGYVRFGVLGTKVVGSITQRYPTVWSERVWVDVASVGTGTPAPPTAEVYAQILANEDAIEDRLDDAEDAIESLDDRLDTAESDIDALESGKVDKVEGMGLSHNDYSDNEKIKVDASFLAKHTHDNMSILNAISQVLVTAWNNSVTWIATNGTNLLNHLSNGTIHVTASDKSTWSGKQNHLTAGENITIVNDVISSSGGTGVTDYDDLTNKPKINNVELSGNKSASDLGIDIPTKTSDLTNDGDGTNPFLTQHQDISTLQPKTDILLSTVAKTIVGAINELFSALSNKVSGVKVAGTELTKDSDGKVDVPIATWNGTQYGVARYNSSYGLTVGYASDGFVSTIKASNSDIDLKTNVYKPIVPANLVYAFNSAKIALCKTTIPAVAVSSESYYLGEQTSVSVVLPSSATAGDMITVVFYSGATATTLSISGSYLGTLPTPSTNQRVELNLLYDGTNWCLLSNTMAVA